MTREVLKKIRKLHITGACGVAIGQLAVLLKNMGFEVTGSDRAIYPPTSDFLKANKFDLLLGFKKDHVDYGPDLIIANSFISKENPEIAYASAHGIKIVGFAEIVNELLIRENSIVVIGNKGKSTITGLIASLLKENGKDPSYLIGGYPKFAADPGYAQRTQSGVKRTNSEWSVVEGDEYPVLAWNRVPKFSLYKTKYLVLTGVKWEHKSVYPTKESYLKVFEDACSKIPVRGAIIACKNEEDDIKPLLKNARAPVYWYNELITQEWNNSFATLQGRIWQENAGAAVVMAREILNLSDDVILTALQNFKGIQRRGEIRYKSPDNRTIVIDDFAHSPIKVHGSIDSLKYDYPEHELVIVYEPGDRSEHSLDDAEYLSCFKGARRVILPHITTASSAKKDYGKHLAEQIKKGFKPVDYIEEDADVIKELLREAQSEMKVVIAFMSQRGFRGMIEELISKLSS